MSFYWAAFVLGIGGSIHCIGMCTPLVVAVTSTRSGTAWRKKLVYNIGRIFTYAVLGGLVGWLGNALNWTEYQDLISILLGLLLILVAVAGTGYFQIPMISSAVNQLTLALKKQFSRFLSFGGMVAMFLTGTINGLLPCGLTYLALTSCLAVASPLEGTLYMMIFGAGTLGVMFGLSGVVTSIIQRTRFNVQAITTALLLVAGVLLITRAALNHAEHTAHRGHMTILCR